MTLGKEVCKGNLSKLWSSLTRASILRCNPIFLKLHLYKTPDYQLNQKVFTNDNSVLAEKCWKNFAGLKWKNSIMIFIILILFFTVFIRITCTRTVFTYLGLSRFFLLMLSLSLTICTIFWEHSDLSPCTTQYMLPTGYDFAQCEWSEHVKVSVCQV